MVKICYRKSYSSSNLWVSKNDLASDFFASSWQRGDSPLPLLIIRLVLTVIALAILIWSIVQARSIFWLVFLTNWAFLLLTLMMVSGTIVSLAACIKKPDENDTGELPWYVSCYWLLFNCAVPVSILVTVLYWVLLYDPEIKFIQPDIFWMDVATHGINSCIAFIEVFSSRTPVRMAHIYQPLGIGVWYTVFSLIYFVAGGTDGNGNPFIYEILDWRETFRSTIIIAASIAGLVIIYTALWGFVLGREKLTGALIRTTSHSLPFTPQDFIPEQMYVI